MDDLNHLAELLWMTCNNNLHNAIEFLILFTVSMIQEIAMAMPSDVKKIC